MTVQLALSLCLAGKSVGILDVDLTGPSIPRLLGLEDAKIKQAPGGWLPVEVHAAQELPPIPSLDLATNNGASNNGHPTSTSDSPDNSPPQTIGSLHAISLAFLLPSRSSAVIWRGPKKTAMVRQFLTDVLWPPSGIDYLLIDTPPGTSDEHIALAETLLSATTTTNTNTTGTDLHDDPSKPTLAGAVVVTTPQAVSVSDVKKELNFCRKTAIPVLGVVENMAGFVCECCGEETDLFGKGGGEAMADEFAVDFLGRVRLDAAWGRLVEEGRRPRYGGPVSDDIDGEGNEGIQDENELRLHEEREGEENGSVEGDDGQKNVRNGALEGVMHASQTFKETDEGLLVDKYRSCKLCETMKEITWKVIERVDNS